MALTSTAGATPNETTSESESISMPNLLVVLVQRATLPSMTSKTMAAKIRIPDQYRQSYSLKL